jgi:hypothetical protein
LWCGTRHGSCGGQTGSTGSHSSDNWIETNNKPSVKPANDIAPDIIQAGDGSKSSVPNRVSGNKKGDIPRLLSILLFSLALLAAARFLEFNAYNTVQRLIDDINYMRKYAIDRMHNNPAAELQ